MSDTVAVLCFSIQVVFCSFLTLLVTDSTPRAVQSPRVSFHFQINSVPSPFSVTPVTVRCDNFLVFTVVEADWKVPKLTGG